MLQGTTCSCCSLDACAVCLVACLHTVHTMAMYSPLAPGGPAGHTVYWQLLAMPAGFKGPTGDQATMISRVNEPGCGAPLVPLLLRTAPGLNLEGLPSASKAFEITKKTITYALATLRPFPCLSIDVVAGSAHT